MLAQIRPEYIESVDAAWQNWRFILSGLAPIALFALAVQWRRGLAVAAPIAVFACWLAASAGVYHVSDVMVEQAVTEDEFGAATADTGRALAPFITIPPLAAGYVLIWLAMFAVVRARFVDWNRNRRNTVSVHSVLETGSRDLANPYKPPSTRWPGP